MELQAAIDKEYAVNHNHNQRRWGLSAFIAGWVAAQRGNDINACPYPDHRTDRNCVTFSRGYRRKWLKGFNTYQNGAYLPLTVKG